MAAAPERKTGRPPPAEEEVADPEGSLQRLADLARRVLEVPKDEVPPIFAKPKRKPPKRKRR